MNWRWPESTSLEEVLKVHWIGASIPRLDGWPKVRGEARYPTDLVLEEMLHAKTVRSPHPHAKILSVDTSEADGMPGVAAVLTASDIPGQNRYGALVQDAPVLAEDVVRYIGEPVALVAAVCEEAAVEAAEAVNVEYQPLRPVTSIEEALSPGAPRLHSTGNVARHTVISRGSPHSAIETSDVVVETMYRTQSQKHMFLEPEGGVAWIDEDGTINVVAGGQNPYRDKLQISRVLGLPMEKIRVVSYPAGGAFGGKDDITVQIHLALLAWKTGKPVRLVWSREESGVVGYHRHPYRMEMKTGATRDGRLTANLAKIYSDTGAYQSFGPAILDVSIEMINGPYRIPNYEIDAYLVYTDNGVASAFRGFGAPQANFAIESQLNMIAEKLGMDKLEIRAMNVLGPREPGSFGVAVETEPSIQRILERARGRLSRVGTPSRGWSRRGIGVALAMKGVGFGAIPDYPAAAIEIDPDRERVVAYFTNPDYGQGVITSCAQIVAEALQLHVDKVEVVNADTALSPDTGSSSASKSTYAAGNALLLAARNAVRRLALEAARILGVPASEVGYDAGFFSAPGSRGRVSIFDAAAEMASRGSRPRFEAAFEIPRRPEPVEGTLEVPHLVFSHALAIAEVDVDLLLAKAEAKDVHLIADVGRLINPVGARAQMEGGAIQGVGYALMEEQAYSDARTENINFTTYIVPTIADVPDVSVEFVEGEEKTGPYGAKGAGEVPFVPIAAAVADAIADATGVRPTELPMNGERLSRLLASAGLLPKRLSRLLEGA